MGMTIEIRGSAISGRTYQRGPRLCKTGQQPGDDLLGVRKIVRDPSGTPPLSLIVREICGKELGTDLALGWSLKEKKRWRMD